MVPDGVTANPIHRNIRAKKMLIVTFFLLLRVRSVNNIRLDNYRLHGRRKKRQYGLVFIHLSYENKYLLEENANKLIHFAFKKMYLGIIVSFMEVTEAVT